MTTKTAKHLTGETIVNHLTACISCLYDPLNVKNLAPTYYFVALSICAHWNKLHPRTTLNFNDLLKTAVKAHNAAHNTQITAKVVFNEIINITN